MGLRFKENNKKLEVSIIGYEFPLSENMDEYDANWLLVKFIYDDGNKEYKSIDPTLLTFEIESLIYEIEDIIQGKETGMISTFLEPYLKLSITKINNQYAIQIRYVYDTSDGIWKEWYISQEMTIDELELLKEGFKEIYNKYPERNSNI